MVRVAIQSFVMQDLFAEQLMALRAASLDRHLRELAGAQGPEIEIAGRRLLNFSSNAISSAARSSEFLNCTRNS
ncbi:MAG: hypothetical protein DMF07_09145 [Verrucomicrobia bacterium]|nr:MAG: hypothetical protein DMF07_09145 [Verrucomicrobiota bacterium]